MTYCAELNNDNTVLRVIVAPDLAWPVEHLGGTWVETADPYAPAQTVRYCGPGHGHDPTFPERFAAPWVMPSPDPDTGVWSSYPKGAISFHDGHLWKSTTDGNVWEPGVSAWHPEPDIEGVLPKWIQPTGAHDVWPLGAQVTHNGKDWESLVANNVWEPTPANSTLWRDLAAPVGPQPWVQPTGGHNAYALGARVTHTGATWESLVNGNVWEPTAANASLWRNLTPPAQAPATATPAWAPGLAVKVGDLYTYQGKTYRVLQAHTTQAGWTPTVVPALWQLV